MTGVGTFLRTVRHLRFGQVIGRVWFRLYRPIPDLRPAPKRQLHFANWVQPAMREPSLISPTRLRFLNVEHDLDQIGWDDPSIDKLWRYNLHYFDDLNARDSSARMQMQRVLIERWIRDNPPGGRSGWEPYPTSLRIVNWIKWFMSGVAPQVHWLDSLAVQARWLRRRLETHLLGNHLFANAKALVYAGVFFHGNEAEGWLENGVHIIQRELDEQILPDGGHFERSPMYHALALEDLLDLINLIGAHASRSAGIARLDAALRDSASRMLHWLRCMCHPDGALGLFNDCAQGVSPDVSELGRYASQLGIEAAAVQDERCTHLSPSGYVRVSRGDALTLLDVAPIGPDYLPGHAHADTLSFELSLGAQRVIVNGGTSCYGSGPQRAYERSTRAHSTVEVDGENSSEVWSGFRVGRRARPSPTLISDSVVCCSHDGYRFLPHKPRHRRCWRFGPGELVVEDFVSARVQSAVARYILAPGLRLQELSSSLWQVLRDDIVIVRIEIISGKASADAASHAPQFGIVLSVDSLAVLLVDGRACTRWVWRDDDAHPVSH